nr:hypothetical protein Iba_chr14eCG10980 [Ipomoea batatas]
MVGNLPVNFLGLSQHGVGDVEEALEVGLGASEAGEEEGSGGGAECDELKIAFSGRVLMSSERFCSSSIASVSDKVRDFHSSWKRQLFGASLGSTFS